MKIFADKELTKQVEDLDFGIVLAGDTKKIVFYLHNDSSADVVEIKPTVSNKDVLVLACPSELKQGESNSIEFSWTPEITLKKGLKTALDLNYYELYE